MYQLLSQAVDTSNQAPYQSDRIKRKFSITDLLNKVQGLYQTKDLTLMSLEDFKNDVTFKYGISLILLDVLEKLVGINFIKLIKEEVFKTPVGNIIDNQALKFLNLRS